MDKICKLQSVDVQPARHDTWEAWDALWIRREASADADTSQRKEFPTE